MIGKGLENRKGLECRKEKEQSSRRERAFRRAAAKAALWVPRPTRKKNAEQARKKQKKTRRQEVAVDCGQTSRGARPSHWVIMGSSTAFLAAGAFATSIVDCSAEVKGFKEAETLQARARGTAAILLRRQAFLFDMLQCQMPVPCQFLSPPTPHSSLPRHPRRASPPWGRQQRGSP